MDSEPSHPSRDDNDADNDDDSYANAYLDDDDNGSDDDERDDDDLAAMFAKVQTLQQAEGYTATSTTTPVTSTAHDSRGQPLTLDVKSIAASRQRASSARGAGGASGYRSSSSTPTSARRCQSPSPSLSSPSAAGFSRSEDGIKTISRRTLGSTGVSSPSTLRIEALLNVKKPAIYDAKLVQTAKSSDLLKKLKTKAVVAAPATIAKRIEDLSAPAKKRTGRKFATDDEERHCRFKPRQSNAQKAANRDRGDDDDGNVGERRNDFIARMEAAEKSKQKKLEMTRGENEYNVRLDKRACPKCTMPQSYSEWKDKKKRCQMCGVEFRVLQAWGDVGSDFIARMSDATQAKALKHEQIRAQVVQSEMSAKRVTKTAKQQFYEKQMVQKNSHRTFLERNYTSSSSTSSAHSKQPQLQAQRQIQAERAKFAATGYDSPVI